MMFPLYHSKGVLCRAFGVFVVTLVFMSLVLAPDVYRSSCWCSLGGAVAYLSLLGVVFS